MQTQQIAVRLPGDALAWLDGEVAAGRYASRAAGITALLRAAEREQILDRDALAMMAIVPDEDELARLEWMRTRTYPDAGGLPGAPNHEELLAAAQALGLQLDEAAARMIGDLLTRSRATDRA